MYRYSMNRFGRWTAEYSLVPWSLVILFSAMAYFVYGGIEGALAILILCILYSAASLISWIPIVGFAIQALLMYWVINPFVFALTGIRMSWLLWMIFWSYILFGAFITFIATLILIVGKGPSSSAFFR